MSARLVRAGLVIAGLLAVAPARADDDPWFARDKALHFSACATIGAGGYGLSALWLERPYQRALAGGGLAIGIGALKEGIDALGYGDPSPRDFTWDVIGAAVGVGLAYGIDSLVHHVRHGREPRVAFRRGALRF